MRRRINADLRNLAETIRSMSPRGRRRTRFSEEIWARVKALVDAGVSVEVICNETGLKPLTVAKRLALMTNQRVKTLLVSPPDGATSPIPCEIVFPNGLRLHIPQALLTQELLSNLTAC